MLEVKKIMTKESEEEVANIILEQVRERNMTISNLKEVTAKVVNQLESNATLGEEDLERKTVVLEGKEQLDTKEYTINISLEENKSVEDISKMLSDFQKESKKSSFKELII